METECTVHVGICQVDPCNDTLYINNICYNTKHITKHYVGNKKWHEKP